MSIVVIDEDTKEIITEEDTFHDVAHRAVSMTRSEKAIDRMRGEVLMCVLGRMIDSITNIDDGETNHVLLVRDIQLIH